MAVLSDSYLSFRINDCERFVSLSFSLIFEAGRGLTGQKQFVAYCVWAGLGVI